MKGDDMTVLLFVIPIVFLVGKFYYDAGKLLLRLLRGAASRLPAPPSAGPSSPPPPGGNWPPFEPERVQGS